MEPVPQRSPPVPARPTAAPPEASLDLGVLAHVDAGKTSLTEALLVAGGALDHVGRVDHGTTQTDTLAQERAPTAWPSSSPGSTITHRCPVAREAGVSSTRGTTSDPDRAWCGPRVQASYD